MPDLDPERIDEVIEACQDNSDRLNAWENGFLESVADQWERNRELSDDQIDKLEQIYEAKVL